VLCSNVIFNMPLTAAVPVDADLLCGGRTLLLVRDESDSPLPPDSRLQLEECNVDVADRSGMDRGHGEKEGVSVVTQFDAFRGNDGVTIRLYNSYIRSSCEVRPPASLFPAQTAAVREFPLFSWSTASYLCASGRRVSYSSALPGSPIFLVFVLVFVLCSACDTQQEEASAHIPPTTHCPPRPVHQTWATWFAGKTQS
jgi:hypothetical protein